MRCSFDSSIVAGIVKGECRSVETEFSQESVNVHWTNSTSYFGNPYKKATGLSNIIKPFCSEGDVVVWLRKFDLETKWQNMDNVVAVIPLFLEGDALALCLELSEQDQDSNNITTKCTVWNYDSANKDIIHIYERKREKGDMFSYLNLITFWMSPIRSTT